MKCSLTGEEKSCRGCENRIEMCRVHKVASIVSMISNLKTLATELGRTDTIKGNEFVVGKVSMYDENVALENTLSKVNGRDFTVYKKIFSEKDINDVEEVLGCIGVSNEEISSIVKKMEELNSGKIVAVTLKPFTSIKLLDSNYLNTVIKEVTWEIDSELGDIVQYIRCRVRGEDRLRKIRAEGLGKEYMLNDNIVLRNGHIKCDTAIRINSRGFIRTVELEGRKCNFIIDNTSIYIKVSGRVHKIGKIVDNKYIIDIAVLNEYSDDCIEDIKELERRLEYIVAYSKSIVPYGIGATNIVRICE